MMQYQSVKLVGDEVVSTLDSLP